tara:strand:- start:55290 stop:55697 length:408 start_codon:yes stop_codon:yes gene_type:complete
MEQRNIIFFDGVCNLCNGFINYIIDKDKNKSIFYSTLQSDFAKTTLNKFDNLILDSNYTTIFYYSNNNLYSKSTAVLYVLSELSPFNKFIAKVLLLIPKFIRDYIYAIISKNRYKLFGKKETCRLPTKEEKQQFI